MFIDRVYDVQLCWLCLSLSAGCLPSVYVVGNMDLKQTAPKVEHYIHRLHQARQQLFHIWNVSKAKLEQCLQLRLFEQDCEDVSWTSLNWS